jgi:mono/diheme cytochrome c family protein
MAGTEHLQHSGDFLFDESVRDRVQAIAPPHPSLPYRSKLCGKHLKKRLFFAKTICHVEKNYKMVMEEKMRTGWILAIGIASGVQAVTAQAATLTDQQMLGRQLYTQHCGVCHTKPTLTSPLYGPALSKETLGGDEETMVQFIKQGTDRMPGFRFMLDDKQIGAMASFLKTMSPPPPEAPAPTNTRAPNIQD